MLKAAKTKIEIGIFHFKKHFYSTRLISKLAPKLTVCSKPDLSLIAFKITIILGAACGLEVGVGGGAESEAGPILARPHQSINSNYYSKFITVTQINAAALLS